MYTQVIILANVYYCVVFTLQKDGAHIVDKYSSQVPAEVREWLAQGNFSMKGEHLRQRHGANLAHGYYIKPHSTDRYFRVHEDNHLEEVNANQFDTPLYAYDGF